MRVGVMLRVLVLQVVGRGGVVMIVTLVAKCCVPVPEVDRLLPANGDEVPLVGREGGSWRFWRAVEHIFGIEVVAALGVAFQILSRLSLDSDAPVLSYATALSLGELGALTYTFVDTGIDMLTTGLGDSGLLDTSAGIGTTNVTDT